ncbi:M23 family metallopeptidase [Cystobacter ferrugineus]|uniref:M23ase beta-sheet core domain-containing protein n=1 Tax=Cystobacter ferrugineus TaxID=83449 RepID=A0A1L9B102_9BACT|nr:peptidoglycan DD-metalloendopeptidase family protein [Cystobacter ferrugineus]OJH35940.1 hypothetical protein BON30_35600 [Cystobacter ferrugineus]
MTRSFGATSSTDDVLEGHDLSNKPGAKVKKGAEIGEVGSTGSCSTGNHLHLTMSKTDTGFMHGDTMDPLNYIHGCD